MGAGRATTPSARPSRACWTRWSRDTGHGALGDVGSTAVSVAVVTDSTAHLPEGFAVRHAVQVVPLHVLVDDVAGLDGVDIGPAELAKAFSERRTVTTSRLAPGELAERYRALLDGGADAVVDRKSVV